MLVLLLKLILSTSYLEFWDCTSISLIISSNHLQITSPTCPLYRELFLKPIHSTDTYSGLFYIPENEIRVFFNSVLNYRGDSPISEYIIDYFTYLRRNNLQEGPLNTVRDVLSKCTNKYKTLSIFIVFEEDIECNIEFLQVVFIDRYSKKNYDKIRIMRMGGTPLNISCDKKCSIKFCNHLNK